MPNSAGKRNRTAILGFEVLWGLSIPFVLVTTVLPGYLNALGLSKVLIGMVPALFSGGIALAQPLSLYVLGSGPGRFRKMLWAYRGAGMCYVVMALFVLLLPSEAVLPRVLSFFACLSAFVLLVGFGDPHYIASIMDTIDPRERGWFFGLRFVCAGTGGLIAGGAASRVLGWLCPPQSFGLSILVGGAIIVIATLWFSRFRPGERAACEPRLSVAECFGVVVRIARGNRRFQLFLAAISLCVLMQGIAVFVVLSIRTRLHAGDSVLGWLGSIELGAWVVFALLLGRIGDRLSYRAAFGAGIALYLAALATVQFGSGQLVLFAGYFLASVLGPTIAVVGFHLGYACSGETNVEQVYSGISVAEAPCRIAGPMLAGVLVQTSGYTPVLVCAAAAGVIVLVLVCAMHSGR